MTTRKLAPNKLVRYRWTEADAGLVLQQPAPDPKPTSSWSVTPYGIDPGEQRTVKEIASAMEKRLSQLVEGEIVLLPLHYSNSWYPRRATRFFDDAFNWEKTPAGIRGETIGERCEALFQSNPARYPHYNFSIAGTAAEAWRIFDHWEHTDHRWALLKSGRLAPGIDPFSIPVEVADPMEAGTVRTIVWVRYKIPPLRTLVVAPTAPGVPDAGKPAATGPLLVALDEDSWRFRLVEDRIVAEAVGQASYADLADGARGTGTAGAGITVDLTALFPAWVKQALTAQWSTGFVVDQPDLTRQPVEYSTADHDFGYGNCHGLTAKIFNLFDDESFALWKDLTASYDAPDATSAPEGAPTRLHEVDPRYQLVNLLTGTRVGPALRETPLTTWAQRDQWPQVQGPTWSGIVQLGSNTFLARILAAGGTALPAGTSPAFGDLGLRKPGFEDHSVIALGVAGGIPALVYALQKIQALAPYAVYTQEISDFDWYRFPRGAR